MHKFVLLTFLSCLVLGLSHPLVSPSCDPNDEFKCNDGKCIPIERHCDNIPDCSNGEDEETCHYLHNCERGLFMCQTGECEPSSSRCNGKRDCSDGSDEFGCSEPSPAVLTSSTTPRSLEMNGNRNNIRGPSHLGNQKLTQSPSRPLTFVCNHDEFQCEDNTCLPLERHCDNIPDCSKGEDENKCEYLHKCEPGLFMCHSGECLRPGARCNGVSDCFDSSDEHGCPKSSSGALTNSFTPRSTEMNGNRESDVWVLLFLVTLFIMIFGVFMFFLCNRYPQVRYRRDLVVDRVATAIKNSSPVTVLKNSSPLTPKREERKPMVSVINPVFS